MAAQTVAVDGARAQEKATSAAANAAAAVVRTYLAARYIYACGPNASEFEFFDFITKFKNQAAGEAKLEACTLNKTTF